MFQITFSFNAHSGGHKDISVKIPLLGINSKVDSYYLAIDSFQMSDDARGVAETGGNGIPILGINKCGGYAMKTMGISLETSLSSVHVHSIVYFDGLDSRAGGNSSRISSRCDDERY
ncbi:hypothetical protein [Chitinophaga rhizophila]|uniref:Uncharacterized protein n=1 Tax=Chitinophaga rhizophila TaxID=2866212 RepID=A0ABS7GI31_9BACT|nr:hypothetical protein [Chitinophaga rhizophila]MBW8686971.1 hypothetical protein [Chitinophaga rhizophila]